jgi:hypothetical protein
VRRVEGGGSSSRGFEDSPSQGLHVRSSSTGWPHVSTGTCMQHQQHRWAWHSTTPAAAVPCPSSNSSSFLNFTLLFGVQRLEACKQHSHYIVQGLVLTQLQCCCCCCHDCCCRRRHRQLCGASHAQHLARCALRSHERAVCCAAGA